MCEYKAIPDGVIKVPVPNVQQLTNFTCGAACVQSICCYFGVGPDNHDEYVRQLKCHPENGTEPARIVKFCKEQGLRAKLVTGMGLDELISCLDADKPVICSLQVYGKEQYYEVAESGHYLIAIGYDDRHIYFEDPWSTGRRTFITIPEFERRWHDKDRRGNPIDRLGIVVWRKGRRQKAKRLK